MFKLTQIDKHSQTFESDDKKCQIVRAGFTTLLYRHGEVWQDKTGDKMFNELLNTLVNQLKPLDEREMELIRGRAFSINNPFCPCDSKTFKKVVEYVSNYKATHDRSE